MTCFDSYFWSFKTFIMAIYFFFSVVNRGWLVVLVFGANTVWASPICGANGTIVLAAVFGESGTWDVFSYGHTFFSFWEEDTWSRQRRLFVDHSRTLSEFATGGGSCGGAESDVMAGGAAILAAPPPRNTFRCCLASIAVSQGFWTGCTTVLSSAP